MSRVDHKQELREKNKVAQFQVLQSDLTEVTAALSANSRENSVLLKQNESIRADCAALLTEKIKLIQDITNFNINFNNRLNTVSKAEEELKEKEIKYLDFISESETLLKNKTKEFEDAIFKLKQELDTLDINISSLRKDELSLSIQVSGLKLTEDQLNSTIEKQQQDIKRMESDKIEILKVFDKDIKNKSDELFTLINKVEKEQRKIDEPMRSLERERDNLSRVEMDLQVYSSRVREWYNKAFPGKEFKL